MEVRKRRLTLGRLMAVIGIVALGFAMSRVDAAPAVSVCVFAACTWYLAGRRYAEALGRIAPEETPIRPSRRARIAARCIIGAALAIGLPDAAFLVGYYGYMWVIRSIDVRNHPSPELEPEHILFGALIGFATALYVATIMRRGPRPAARRRGPRPADRAESRPAREDGRDAAMPVSASRSEGPGVSLAGAADGADRPDPVRSA